MQERKSRREDQGGGRAREENRTAAPLFLMGKQGTVGGDASRAQVIEDVNSSEGAGVKVDFFGGF